MVRIEARAIEQVDSALLMQLERIPKNYNFSVIGEEREETFFPNEFVSAYEKKLSNKSYDFISIHIFYFGPKHPKKDEIKVKIENKLRGQDPPVKSQIDELGDIFYEELSRSVGKDKVNIERKPTSIPLLY